MNQSCSSSSYCEKAILVPLGAQVGEWASGLVVIVIGAPRETASTVVVTQDVASGAGAASWDAAASAGPRCTGP